MNLEKGELLKTMDGKIVEVVQSAMIDTGTVETDMISMMLYGCPIKDTLSFMKRNHKNSRIKEDKVLFILTQDVKIEDVETNRN